MCENYFDEKVAATYDRDSTPRFEPAVVDATVAFLAELRRRCSDLLGAPFTGESTAHVSVWEKTADE